jgi:hypothetical protein
MLLSVAGGLTYTRMLQRFDGTDFAAWIQSIESEPAITAFNVKSIAELYNHPDIVRMYRCKAEDGSEVPCDTTKITTSEATHNATADLDGDLDPLRPLDSGRPRDLNPSPFLHLNPKTSLLCGSGYGKRCRKEAFEPHKFAFTEDGSEVVSEQSAKLWDNTESKLVSEAKKRKQAKHMLAKPEEKRLDVVMGTNTPGGAKEEGGNKEGARGLQKDLGRTNLTDLQVKSRGSRIYLEGPSKLMIPTYRRNIQYRGSLRFQNNSKWGIPPGVHVRRALLTNYMKWFEMKGRQMELTKTNAQYYRVEAKKNVVRMKQVRTTSTICALRLTHPSFIILDNTYLRTTDGN